MSGSIDKLWVDFHQEAVQMFNGAKASKILRIRIYAETKEFILAKRPVITERL